MNKCKKDKCAAPDLIKAHRAADPHFEKAIEACVKAEATHKEQQDPAQGKTKCCKKCTCAPKPKR